MTTKTKPTPGTQELSEFYNRVSKSLRTVLVFTISDAFGLEEEEAFWVSFQVNKVLEPLWSARPRAIPLPVKRELENGIYSRLLVEKGREGRECDGETTQASIQDWAQVLAELVTETYTLRPLMDATIVAHFVGILRELGVGAKGNPRASNYLPNAVRHKLNEG